MFAELFAHTTPLYNKVALETSYKFANVY